MKNKKAESKISIVNIVISIILIIALVPIIVVFSAGTQQCLEDNYPYLLNANNKCCNTTHTYCNATTSGNTSSTNSLSTTERTMLGLIGLFIILAFIFNVVQASGLVKKK
jgi:hypothetical protein